MNVDQLLSKLQQLDKTDEVLVTDADMGEYGSQIERIDIRRIYDNGAEGGERRVVVITMKEYGNREFEFINEQSST